MKITARVRSYNFRTSLSRTRSFPPVPSPSLPLCMHDPQSQCCSPAPNFRPPPPLRSPPRRCSCLPHVTSLVDPANLGPLTLYASILWAAVWAVVRRDAALMWALGFLVVPILPASNLFFPVGVVMAERVRPFAKTYPRGEGGGGLLVYW